MITQLHRKQSRSEFMAETRKTFGWLTLSGLTMISLSCMYEILYGNSYTHPIWNKDYNWMPIIMQVLVVAGISGLIIGYTRVYGRPKVAIFSTPLKKVQTFGFELISKPKQLVNFILASVTQWRQDRNFDLKNL